jgi:hypothetical protein
VNLKQPDSFDRIKDLLRRVGINPKNTTNLFQTCHILRDGNEFYICHFKELFWIDGKSNNMTVLDVERRNRIISLLVRKNLIDVDLSNLPFTLKAARSIFIVPFAEINNWKLHSKYKFRKARRISPKHGTIN